MFLYYFLLFKKAKNNMGKGIWRLRRQNDVKRYFLLFFKKQKISVVGFGGFAAKTIISCFLGRPNRPKKHQRCFTRAA
jgi:hypothetical protein